MTSTITSVPLHMVAPDAVEQLLDEAFGTDRRSRTAYRLRAGVRPLPEFSRAILFDDMPIATIQCWPVALAKDTGGRAPMILVGPVAVAPARQRDGLGRALMTEMLNAAGKDSPLMLVGDPEYYQRFFGFTAQATSHWRLPGPFERRRLLARGAVEDVPGLVVPDPER